MINDEHLIFCIAADCQGRTVEVCTIHIIITVPEFYMAVAETDVQTLFHGVKMQPLWLAAQSLM